MSVIRNAIAIHRYIGLSTDTKPTTSTATPIPNGSTFLEYDTQALYITYDGTNWVLKDPFGEVQATPTAYTLLRRVKDLLQSIVHLEHPFAKGDLTSDGVQWTDTTDTTTADTDVTVDSAKTIEPPASGSIVEVEFALTGGFRAVSSATADLIYKWQARDKDGTWVTLVTVTKTDIGTTEVEETYSGRFTTVANFDAVPFDVQLVIQCNEANQGRARIKNSSYVKVIYNSA